MVFRLDGKTQETRGRRDDCLDTHESRGLGELRVSSSSNGFDQGRRAENGCAGQDSTWKDAFKPNSTPGKILQRLKLIEDKYSTYVDNHQKLLEAQLAESKAHKLELTQEIADLERELYNLVSDPSEKEQE